MCIRDRLSTPEDIQASKTDLPEDATFVVVDGAVHSFFGDYGSQRGDNEPGIPREQAQQEIQAAMLEFLNGLPAAAP